MMNMIVLLGLVIIIAYGKLETDILPWNRVSIGLL